MIKAEEEVEKQLRKEILDLSEGWRFSHDEYTSIKYIKESRLSRIHPYTTRTGPLIFFHITGEGDNLRITPHVSNARANTSGHKIPGKAKGAKATGATKEAPATKVPDANTAQNRNEQNKESKKRKGNTNRNKNRGKNNKNSGKNNKNNKTISKGGNKTTEKTALTQIAAPRVSSPQPSTSRQAAPTPPVAARTNSNPPARRTLSPTVQIQPRTHEPSKNGHRYIAPHLRENRGNQNSRYTNPPPPTRTTGAPSYPPPATFRWTPTGWERIQRDEPTGRNDRRTGSVARYQPLCYVPNEGQDQN